MRSFPVEAKLTLIKRVQSGEKVARICREAGISRKTFYSWLKKYKEAKPNVVRFKLSDRRFKRIFSFKTLNQADKLLLINQSLADYASVSQLCRKFGLSRKTFYKWLRRYQELGENGLSDARPVGDAHHRAIPQENRQQVLDFVAQNPHYSVHRLAQELNFIGHHGLQNLLAREGLNTLAKRQLFAQGYVAEPKVKVAPQYVPEMPMYRLRQLIAPFVTIPKLLFTKPKKGIWYLVFGILPLVIFAFWTRLLLTAPSGTSLLGLIFASIALTFGLFFFIYSVKYYLTILMVLRLASSGAKAMEDRQSGGSQTSDKEQLTTDKKKFSIFNFQFSIPKLINYQSRSRVNPLLINLEKVELESKPFVSIHVAIYNETKVIERLIRAVSSQDWPNYEVIICDDSNDETTEIAVNTLKEIYKELNTTQIESATIYKTTSTDKNQPTFTLIHRQERYGYKGGALQKALEATDPRAEYICVFDADFVPYPDTVEQFVKTFQVLTVGSGESVVGSQNVASTNYELQTTNSASRIAAVQGYQWHVLNKSENWITRGVRTEYAGSYVIERSGEEIYQGLKQIAGSVYCIRADILRAFGWGTSITEDFELTLRLYEAGYKIAFTPYIQAPAEAVSTVRRLIRQRMRWAEGASFNVKVMLARMLFGKWEAVKSITGSKSTTGTTGNEGSIGAEACDTHDTLDTRGTHRVWVPSRLTLAEKLEFAYLAPYYLQAAFLVVGTFSWFLAEAILGARLPFWTAAFGWSLVFTNLLSLPLMNIIGLFLEESDERDYIGILSFIALSYIVVPFQAYAAIKGFLEREEGPWFRTPKTGLITDVLDRSGFSKFFGNIFGRPAGVPTLPAGRQVTADGGRLALNLASAYNPLHGNISIRPRYVRWVGNLALAVIIAITVLMSVFAPFVPTTTSYASQLSLKTPEEAKKPELATSGSKPASDSGHFEQEITTPRVITKTNRGGVQIEAIFHQEPRVRLKIGGREVEFETKTINGQAVNPSKSLIYQDKEVTYKGVLENIDIKYTMTGDLLVEEIILHEPLTGGQKPIFERSEQSLNTIDIKVVYLNQATFGFYPQECPSTSSGQVECPEVFRLSAPFAKDAKGQVSNDLSFSLEKSIVGYTLIKTAGESAKKWFLDPARVYPVIVDPSIIVSPAIAEENVQFGGLQRKVVFVNSNWYAFYNDEGKISYKKSSDGTTWGSAVDLDSDADNYNPSIGVSSTMIIVFWIDDGADAVEGRTINTASSDAQGTLCTSTDQGTLSSTFMVTTAAVSTSEAVVAFSDTNSGTDFNAFDAISLDGSCSYGTIDLTPGNITFGSGITVGDRPVVFPITGNRVGMVFQDGDLSYSEVDVSVDEWTKNNLQIANVTDNVYSVTTDGTTFWVLSVSGTTATNFYSCCTADFAETQVDSDAGANDQDGISDIDMYCVTSTDCKIVYTDDIDSADPILTFVDCDNEDCSSKTVTPLDSNIGAAGDQAGVSIYCVATDNCKVVYGDAMDSANPLAVFVDCATSACATASATFTTVDADLGSSTSVLHSSIYCSDDTNCKFLFNDSGAGDFFFVDCPTDAVCGATGRVITTIDAGAGAQVKSDLDCSTGSNNCKIIYTDGGASAWDLVFTDCTADEDCSTNTDTIVDTDIGTTGSLGAQPVSIDCLGQDLDCKFIYGDSTAGDLFFVDCPDATCTATGRTITTIDAAGGANTLTSTSASMDCVAADDCKFTYVGALTSGSEQLYFVDCDDTTCSTGSVIGLPGAPTGPRFQAAISCVDDAGAASSTNCKFAYYDGTASTAPQVDLADCDTTNCFPSPATLSAPYVPLAFDAPSSKNSEGGVTSLSWPHTTSGTDRILIVGVSLNRGASSITGVTYNSVAMTNIGTAGFGTAFMSLWQLVAPATGEHDIVVSLSGFAEVIGGATSWTGVHQTTPLGTFASATGTSTSPSVNVTSATGEMVVDTLNARGTATATVDPSQTERWNLLTTGAEPVRGTGSNESGAATVTMSWTLGASEGWAIGGVSLKPVGTTNLSSVSLSLDTTNSQLYAHVIKDTNEKAYFKSSDKTTISWTGEYDYGWSGSGDHLGHINSPITGTNANEIAAVLRETNNYEFATLPERALFLLGAVPFLPAFAKRLRRGKPKLFGKLRRKKEGGKHFQFKI